jgi:hypothetical protein
MKYFGAALYHAGQSELDYAVFYAKLSAHPQKYELIRICLEQQAVCRGFKIKACEYGKKRWYKHSAKQFAAALKINAQDETALRGLLNTAGKGFIL